MNNVSDDDLILLYYGEHDDPELAQKVAESKPLSMRFEQLCTELEGLNQLETPALAANYGETIWQKIRHDLYPAQNQQTKQTKWHTRVHQLFQPRLSFATVFAVGLVTVFAFWMGQQSMPQSPAGPGIAADQGPINPQKLFTSQVAMHLENTDRLLTQLSNITPVDLNSSQDSEALWAAELLMSNRIYKQAAQRVGHKRLTALLTELEPLLLELAHNANNPSPTTRERLGQEAGDELLFKVRLQKDHLVKNRDPI